MKNKIIILLCILTAIIGVLLYWAYKTVQRAETTYEYALNNEIYISNKCRLRNGIAFCKNGNIMVEVQSYYEVGK